MMILFKPAICILQNCAFQMVNSNISLSHINETYDWFAHKLNLPLSSNTVVCLQAKRLEVNQRLTSLMVMFSNWANSNLCPKLGFGFSWNSLSNNWSCSSLNIVLVRSSFRALVDDVFISSITRKLTSLFKQFIKIKGKCYFVKIAYTKPRV